MRRKVLCALLVLAAALTLCACSSKSQTSVPVMTSALSSADSVTPTPVADAIPSVVLTPLQTPKPVHPAVSETPMPLATLAPKPAATGIPEPAATPAALAAAQSNAPIVLKQPTGEGHFIGESAMFIVDARNYSSLHWNAVSPSGREIDMKTFRETFPDCSVIGEKDTTLLITNLNIDMSGWSFFCTFENADASTSTEKARLRVRDPRSTDPANTKSDSKSDSKTDSKTDTDTAAATQPMLPHCPACGSEVPRDLLSCPYCGKQIYTQNEYANVTQYQTGDIYYRDNTGSMFFDSTDGTSTFVDNNGNYTIFNENGLVQSGNYNKEDEEAEQLAILESFLAGEDEAEQQAALLAMLGY